MIRSILDFPDRIFAVLEPLAPALLPTLARFIFAAVLLVFFWNSGMTKLPEGFASLFSPSFNAFAQMFPQGAAAVGYDITQATFVQKAVILVGTWTEFILPALIVVGLYTRAAAVGMIGFIVVMSLTDMYGHGAEAGRWFDNLSSGIILDQRAMWVFLLTYLVLRGGGPLSLDRALFGRSVPNART